MMSAYFSQSISILASFDNNAHTTQQYAEIMLYGLNTAFLDPTKPADNAQISTLNTEYNNIMAQYGITSAAWNSYIATQLTAATADKLPTNCTP
jgi:hypothetical protein